MSGNPNDAVWFEIAVGDLDKSMRFYESVVGAPLAKQEMGGETLAVFPHAPSGAVSGHLHQNGAAGSTSSTLIHLAVPAPLEDTLRKVTEAGGKVDSPIVPLPAGRFAYCRDLDGNRFGAFTAS